MRRREFITLLGRRGGPRSVSMTGTVTGLAGSRSAAPTSAMVLLSHLLALLPVSIRQLSVLMLCSLTTGPQSFIWSAKNLRCTSGPPICNMICIASMRLLISGSRSVSANALLKRSTIARGVRPAVNEPHQAYSHANCNCERNNRAMLDFFGKAA
jgi:hypothetical protein